MYLRLDSLVNTVKALIRSGVESALRKLENDTTGKAKRLFLWHPDQLSIVKDEIEKEGKDVYIEKAVFTHVNRLFALYQLEERGIMSRYISDESVGQGEILDAYRYGCKEAADILGGPFESGIMHGEVIPDSIDLYKAISAMRQWKKSVGDRESNMWLRDDLLGWVYQIYAKEYGDEIRSRSSGRGISVSSSRELSVVTQYYTDDYIVEYIVENTLSMAEKTFSYREIKVLDPAVGSGHFLIKVFDWFVARYERDGMLPEDIVGYILDKHLCGLDIDERAVQIASLVLLIKAADYIRKSAGPYLRKEMFPRPNIVSPVEGFFDRFTVDKLKKASIVPDSVVSRIEDVVKNLHIYGSLVDLNLVLSKETRGRFVQGDMKPLGRLLKEDIKEYIKSNNIVDKLADDVVKRQWQFIDILLDSYHVVVSDPPYLKIENIKDDMKDFLKRYYPSVQDIGQAFMLRAARFTDPYKGYWGMVNSGNWLFLKNASNFRVELLDISTPVHVVDLGANAFKQALKIGFAINIFRSDTSERDGNIVFIDVSDVNDYEEKKGILRNILSSQDAIDQLYKDRIYVRRLSDFVKLGKRVDKYGLKIPLVYIFNEDILSLWDKHPTVGEVAYVPRGITTGRDREFIRYHWEVRREDINFNYPEEKNDPRWVPLSKGGGDIKWYGGLWWVIDWENDGKRLKSFEKAQISGEKFYGKAGVFCAYISSEKLIRYLPEGLIFSNLTVPVFAKDEGAISPYIYQVLLGTELIRFIAYYLEPGRTSPIWLISLLPFPKELTDEDKAVAESLGKLGIALKKKRISIFPIEMHYEGSPLRQYGSVRKHTEISDVMDVYLHLIEGAADRVAARVYGVSDETLDYIYKRLERPVALLPITDPEHIDILFDKYPPGTLLPGSYREEFNITDDDIERVMEEVKGLIQSVEKEHDVKYNDAELLHIYGDTKYRREYYNSAIKVLSQTLGVNPISTFFILDDLFNRYGVPEKVDRFENLLALDEAVIEVLRESDFGILAMYDLLKRVTEWFDRRNIPYVWSTLRDWLKDPKGYAVFHKRLYRGRSGGGYHHIVFYLSEMKYGGRSYTPRAVLYGLHQRIKSVWVDVMRDTFKYVQNIAAEEDDEMAIEALEKATFEVEKIRNALENVHPDDGVACSIKALDKFIWID